MSIATEKPVARTALDGRSALDGAVALRELPLRGKLTLRGDRADAAFARAVQAVSASELPIAVGETAVAGGISLTCLGPDEWMLCCPLEETDALHGRLLSSASDSHMAVVDVSDYYTELELSGGHTRDVLAKLTPLDVSATALVAGTVVATRMAKTSTVLHMATDDSAVIQVRWSHAEYLWDYLIEAAREYNR